MTSVAYSGPPPGAIAHRPGLREAPEMTSRSGRRRTNSFSNRWRLHGCSSQACQTALTRVSQHVAENADQPDRPRHFASGTASSSLFAAGVAISSMVAVLLLALLVHGRGRPWGPSWSQGRPIMAFSTTTWNHMRLPSSGHRTDGFLWVSSQNRGVGAREPGGIKTGNPNRLIS